MWARGKSARVFVITPQFSPSSRHAARISRGGSGAKMDFLGDYDKGWRRFPLVHAPALWDLLRFIYLFNFAGAKKIAKNRLVKMSHIPSKARGVFCRALTSRFNGIQSKTLKV